jgi:hypothetical protein
LNQALVIDRATIAAGHPDYAICFNNLAGVVRRQDQSEQVEKYYLEALRVLDAILPTDQPNIQITLNSLARLRAEKD